MGQILFNPQRNVQQGSTQAPALPRAYGMAPIEARKRQGQAIAQTVDHAAQIIGAHARKNIKQEMEADEAAFRSFTSQRMQAAELAAAQTADMDEVRGIYEAAEFEIKAYVDGKNEAGAQNFRWKDQQEQARNRTDLLTAEVRNAGARRAVAISRADTKAKAERQISDGIEAGHAGQIKQGVELLRDSGFLTYEEAANQKKAHYQQADDRQARKVLIEIEALGPEDAETALAGFESALGDEKQYKHLGEAERLELGRLGKAALHRSQEAADRARRLELNASADRLMDYQLEHEGDLPSMGELEGLNLSREHRLAVMKAYAPQRQRAAQVEQFGALRDRIAAFERGKDPEGAERMGIMIELAQLPSDLKAPLKELWTLKSTPGKEVQAEGAKRLADFIQKTDFADWSAGDGWSNEEEAEQLYKELDRFNRWVKQEKPSDGQILDYVNTDPVLKQMRDAGSRKAFRKVIAEPVAPRVEAAPVAFPGLGAQAGYLKGSDEDVELLGVK